MFEKEIQFITDFNLNKIKNLGSSFTFDELLKSDLHPALIQYISGRIDFMILEERKILLENSMFDYSGAKIAHYFNLIAEEIKKTKKLFFREIEEFVKKGIVFNANYTTQPKTTLTSLIFKDGDAARSTAEVKVFLNYSYYYPYYKEIINSYITKRKVVNFTKSEFKNLLSKIDSQLLSTKKEDIISDALTSISDFYNDGGVSKSRLQPALVEAYLKEKNLDEMIEILKQESVDKKQIEIVELKKILFTIPLIKKEAIEEVQQEEEIKETEPETENKDEEVQAVQEEINKPEIKVEDVQEQSKPEVKEELKEELKEIQQPEVSENKKDAIEKEKIVESESVQKTEVKPETESEIKPEAESKEETINNEAIFEEEIIENYNQEDEIDMEELIEEDVPLKRRSEKKDIFLFLNQKDVERIVSGIFNDDEDDFISTLEKISECDNYEQAAEILKSVFFTYKINPYKKEAVTLTNAVSNYFDQD